MDDERYIALIQKDLVGSITNSESLELRQWIGDNKDRQDLYDSISEIWDATSAYKPNIAVNLDEEYGRLSSKLNVGSEKKKVFSISTIVAIAATITLFVSIGFWWSSQEPESGATTTTAIATNERVYLPDSSYVLLEQGSRITFGKNFLDERRLSFTGSAFFNIKTNPERPLIIKGARSSVTVLGTTFLYEDSNTDNRDVLLQLIHGAVKIEAGSKEYKLLGGQSIRLNASDDQEAPIRPLNPKEFGWYEHSFNFNKTALSDVITSISSFYNVDILLDEQMKDCYFTGELPAVNVEETLSIVNSVYGSQLAKQSNVYNLTGGTCN